MLVLFACRSKGPATGVHGRCGTTSCEAFGGLTNGFPCIQSRSFESPRAEGVLVWSLLLFLRLSCCDKLFLCTALKQKLSFDKLGFGCLVSGSLRLVMTAAGSLVKAGWLLDLSAIDPRTVVRENTVEHGFPPSQGFLKDLLVLQKVLNWIVRRGVRKPLPV